MPYQRRKLTHVASLSGDKFDYYECEACAWNVKVPKGDVESAQRAFDAHNCKGH